MKRTPLKKVSKTQNIKLRIQKLLRAILLKEYGNKIVMIMPCAFFYFQSQSVNCSGVFQCDHKFSRSHNSTFADFDNLHILCSSHNSWKHRYGEEARGFMDKLYGKKKMDALQKKAHQSCPMSKDDWLKVESALKAKLEELEELEKRQLS